jgi:hypothetical protein
MGIDDPVDGRERQSAAPSLVEDVPDTLAVVRVLVRHDHRGGRHDLRRLEAVDAVRDVGPPPGLRGEVDAVEADRGLVAQREHLLERGGLRGQAHPNAPSKGDRAGRGWTSPSRVIEP